ncbi:MAG: amidohydrolase [Candidatus Bathyarchaeota archaeon]|nr:MAG: amidohydrolase [Candidatus Bathyarchaeota archaeon]
MDNEGALEANMVLVDGKVLTVDQNDSIVEAVAIKGSRILAMGTTSDIMKLTGEGTRVIELNGKTVLPGIIDTHTHPSGAAVRLHEISCRSPPVESIGEILEMVAEKVAEVGPGWWIRGANYNDIKLRERRHITRWELDEVAPENPVFISKETGHLYVVNSRALEIAGITEETPDPPGGKIDRTGEREATGLLYETASTLVYNMIPPYTVKEIKEGMRRVWDQFSEWGVTTTHDASGYRDAIVAYQQLLSEGIRQVRTLLMVSARRPEGTDIIGSLRALGVQSGFGDYWLKVMSLKIMGDGSGSGGSAAVYTPQHRGMKDLGLMTTSEEEITRLTVAAHEMGIRVSIHSIGDRGIDAALDAIEEAQRRMPMEDMRHRIEHNSVCTPKQLERIKALGVTPSSSIGYMYGIGDDYVENFGPERVRWLHPHKTMQETGITAGGNNDYPVTSYSPFVQIYEAVTRRTRTGQVVSPEEAIGVMDAVRLYTWNGAYLGKEEDSKGSIEPGKLADLIVIDMDILTIPHEEIKEIKVLTTIVGGRIVYKR